MPHHVAVMPWRSAGDLYSFICPDGRGAAVTMTQPQGYSGATHDCFGSLRLGLANMAIILLKQRNGSLRSHCVE